MNNVTLIMSKWSWIRMRVVFRGSESDLILLEGRIRIKVNYSRIRNPDQSGLFILI